MITQGAMHHINKDNKNKSMKLTSDTNVKTKRNNNVTLAILMALTLVWH